MSKCWRWIMVDGSTVSRQTHDGSIPVQLRHRARRELSAFGASNKSTTTRPEWIRRCFENRQSSDGDTEEAEDSLSQAVSRLQRGGRTQRTESGSTISEFTGGIGETTV